MIRLNNNFGNYAASFCGVRKGSDTMPDKDTVLKKIVTTSNGLLAEAACRQVPENNKFVPVSIDYKLPSSQNRAKVTVEYDNITPENQRRISVGVYHQNRDRVISNYLYKGTKNEVIEYLKDEKNQQAFIDAIKTLSDKTDEYYSSL